MYEKTIFLAESEKHVRDALRLSLEHQTEMTVTGEANHSFYWIGIY
jgi:hypothetical protein